MCYCFTMYPTYDGMVQPSQCIEELAVIPTLMALPTRFSIFAATICLINYTAQEISQNFSLLHDVVTDNVTIKYLS
jgi:hypothetical protein